MLSEMKRTQALEVHRPETKFHFPSIRAASPWAHEFVSLTLSFLKCNMWIPVKLGNKFKMPSKRIASDLEIIKEVP